MLILFWFENLHGLIRRHYKLGATVIILLDGVDTCWARQCASSVPSI